MGTMPFMTFRKMHKEREKERELNDIDEKLTSWYIYIELCQASSNWGVLTGSEAVRK